jgi:sodium-independent sulfate anion transporter 11
VVTPPSTLYEFWKISPLDVIIFITGLSITIFYNIEAGIYATIILSLFILVFRVFHAHGGFLGKVKVRTVKHEHEKWSPATTSSSTNGDDADPSRNVFLPLNRRDGSNPTVDIERPGPGIFIYRFSEGFNFPNANSQLDYLAHAIMAETKRTVETEYEKPGDRPWNDYTPRRAKRAMADDNRPTLKAVILDFSAVNNVDLTAVQTLIDVRNQLDKYAAPGLVQWHFACINSRWTKRALAAGGFGYPTFGSDDGRPEKFKSIYSLAEMQGADGLEKGAVHERRPSVVAVTEMNGDVELGDLTSTGEKVVVSRMEDLAGGSGGSSVAIPSSNGGPPQKMTAVHGINRPFFHPDVQSALVSALATEELREAMREDEDDAVDGFEAVPDSGRKEVKVERIETI